MAGLAIVMIFVQIGVLVAARLLVKGPARWGLYAISGAALMLLLAGLVWLLPVGVTIGAPPFGVLVLLGVAIGASVAILWIALRNGWLGNWAGRAGAGLLIYVVLLIAFPPMMPHAWLAGGVLLALLLVVVWWLDDERGKGPQVGQPATATTMNSELILPWEDGNDDNVLEDGADADNWVSVPVAAATVDGWVRESEPGQAGGGASADGSGAVRQPGGASAGVGVGGDSAGEQSNGNSPRAGEDHAGNGMAWYPAVAAVDRGAGRRGRGRRLAGALVPRTGASGDGAGAGGYDAAGAVAAASIAPAA